MKNKATPFKKIYLLLLIPIILIIMDFLNLPSYIFNMGKINWDFSAAVINSAVVIILYLITYIALDKRSIMRENNKNEVAYMLIKKSYNEAKKQADLMTIEIIKKYVVPKIDFNSIDNALVNNLCSAPFEDENLILEMVKDGQISKELLDGYFSVKKSYSIYMNSIITFFDAPKIYKPMKIEFYKILDSELDNIENKFKV